ncbi:hypothetical protein FisN_9Lh253 [Fistulifera solaris]|uniref:MORN repeat-containing protein n=1 Tax=Fistulifera solaris TaxID=1519565 RepID=A0A1Z5KKZ3_FISSO|nr:hypothetical protein FisN_9Lh253 [Fistulifera solaris]|eukprot:GAX26949.1 hypothetical protein FisN_9Lh253 [Fistulifera solaris]
MIALKGKIEREGTAWTWKGRWCFGAEFMEGINAKKIASMPFAYTWERPVSPHEMEIPPERGIDYDKEEGTPKSTSNEVVINDEVDNNTKNASNPNLQEENQSTNDETTTKHQEEAKIRLESKEEEKPNNGNVATENMQVEESITDPPEDQLSGDAIMEVSKLATPATKHRQQTSVATVGSLDKTTLATPRRRTFADKVNPDDPDFTDAGTKYYNECPPSGAWQGYFETTVGRKKPQALPVPENFCLCLNATPAANARACFPNDMMMVAAKTKETFNGGLLPAGRILVRGIGANQYGTFELIGSLERETGIMHCQRLYYPLPQKQIRSRKRRQSGTAESIDASRPTRKRQLSWKKRAEHDDDDEPQQRRRRSSTLSPSSQKKVMDDNTSEAPPIPLVAMADSVASAITPVALKTGPSKPFSLKRTPSSHSSIRNRNLATKNSSNINGTTIKLPSAGDAAAARWRAAHYLYYQKAQPPSEDGTNKTPHQQAAKYVIYEGEMYNSQRHGRGVCLYTNGLLYEGEWYQDKEHGAGTIMSSDRKRIIYKGDFTYGKIHGAGIYYYYQTRKNTHKKTVSTSAPEKVSRYEGEFKEMLRHGTGTYHLPDGSVYSGQFRDNQFCGRGTFTWPDGSVYDGEWKDGKRHGLGVLRSSDGFTYDGSWVNNAMDGRGSAVYPGGQAYNGLFSNGRREGRGTITFTNGAVYEGRFREDLIDGQGTMKMGRIMVVPDGIDMEHGDPTDEETEHDDKKKDFMIPLSFQSDMGHIHRKAGFTVMGE